MYQALVSVLWHVVPFLLVLGLIVFCHELGHFVAAKRSGMRVFEFALGFGPVAKSWESKGTVYSLRVVPIGGFVRIAGMEPGEDPDMEGSFSTKPFLPRLLTLSAGCIMNFVLAVVIYIGIGMVIGLPDGTETNQVAQVISGGVAEKAGLKAGDRLMAINDERTSDSKRLRERIYSSPSKPVVLTVERDGRLIRLSAVPKPTQVPDDKGKSGTKTVGTIGFYFQPVLKRVGPFTAVWAGTRHAWLTTKDMVLTLADMVRGRAEGGLGGPVAVMRVTGETAQSQGAHGVFLLAAMLSLNIGLLNLLPLPALDGGWIFFLIFEALRGRKLNPAKQAMVQYVGLVVILILMLMVTFKDISNWVMGQGPR